MTGGVAVTVDAASVISSVIVMAAGKAVTVDAAAVTETRWYC